MSGIGAVFDAGAADFVTWSRDLWEPGGQLAVAAAGLLPGERVLDACCGAGASAVPAAAAVGSTGRVVGVDLAPELLAVARAEADARGLSSVDFVEGDVMSLPAPDPAYDAVICVYGVFFLPDMDAGGRALLSQLRPGGRLVVATWRRGAIAPVLGALWAAVKDERPEQMEQMENRGNPAARVETVESLTAWLQLLGGSDPVVTEHPRRAPLTSDSAWRLVLGSAARALIAGLDDTELARVRERVTAAVPPGSELVADTLVGVARRVAEAPADDRRAPRGS